MENGKRISFMTTAREFFGMLPGQKAIDFGREVQALTDKDREEIAQGLEREGYVIDPASIPKPVIPSERHAA